MSVETAIRAMKRAAKLLHDPPRHGRGYKLSTLQEVRRHLDVAMLGIYPRGSSSQGELATALYVLIDAALWTGERRGVALRAAGALVQGAIRAAEEEAKRCDESSPS
jgi:hypothetical protein